MTNVVSVLQTNVLRVFLPKPAHSCTIVRGMVLPIVVLTHDTNAVGRTVPVALGSRHAQTGHPVHGMTPNQAALTQVPVIL